MVERTPFIKTLCKPGTISLLTGLPGDGKTNLLVFFIEKGVDYGFNVWTIIQFFEHSEIPEACNAGLLPKGVLYRKLPPEVHTVRRVSDLLLGLLTTWPNTCILDESSLFASSRTPMKKELRDLLNLTYIIRHLRSSFIFCTQTEESLIPDIRYRLPRYKLIIRKKRNEYRILTIKARKLETDDEGEEHIRFKTVKRVGRIPLTRYPWDGHYIPKFDFDIDLDEAWSRLGEYGSLKVRKVGADIIRNLVEEGVEDKNGKPGRPTQKAITDTYNEVKEMYHTLEDSGDFKNKSMVVRELAQRYKKSISWVDQITKGMPFDKSKYNPKVGDN